VLADGRAEGGGADVELDAEGILELEGGALRGAGEAVADGGVALDEAGEIGGGAGREGAAAAEREGLAGALGQIAEVELVERGGIAGAGERLYPKGHGRKATSREHRAGEGAAAGAEGALVAASLGGRAELGVEGAVCARLHGGGAGAGGVFAELEVEGEGVAWGDGLAGVADEAGPGAGGLAGADRALLGPRERRRGAARGDDALDDELAVAGQDEHVDARGRGAGGVGRGAGRLDGGPQAPAVVGAAKCRRSDDRGGGAGLLADEGDPIGAGFGDREHADAAGPGEGAL
jgi:hypothetical protein